MGQEPSLLLGAAESQFYFGGRQNPHFILGAAESPFYIYCYSLLKNANKYMLKMNNLFITYLNSNKYYLKYSRKCRGRCIIIGGQFVKKVRLDLKISWEKTLTQYTVNLFNISATHRTVEKYHFSFII